MKDFYGSPIKDTVLTFQSIKNDIEKRLYITSFEILNNHKLVIKFNFNLDTLTSLNKINYSFSPYNIVKQVNYFNNEKKSIVIETENPFGAIGKEYVLKVENIFSDIESGKVSIDEHSGSEIVLTSNAENLNEMYVYPNPVNPEIHNKLTFANLTQAVDIYIYSLDGIFIKKLVEIDGNGGVSWNLLNSNNMKISSGIYIYKAISLDEIGKTKQEKIGKFVVIN